MTTPQWITSAGNIGAFAQLVTINYTFTATPENIGNTIQYGLISGAFPIALGPAFSLNSTTGVLSGTPDTVSTETVYTFTIRAIEYSGATIVGTSDRTFSITVVIPQPTWVTTEGNIGSYSDGVLFSYTFLATPGTVGNTLRYTKLNGNFPITDNINVPITLSTSGILSGTPGSVNGNVISSFTIRVIEYNGSNPISFSDRTFSMTVVGADTPTFITTGPWTYNDTQWVSIPFAYNNPDPNTTVNITLQSGSLPSGLELNSAGLLQGYLDIISVPTVNNTFNLNISNGYANSNSTFSMTVNQTVGPRSPTIYNNRPPSFDVTDSEYSSYYFSGSSMGVYEPGSIFIFKIIGHDFENQELSYNITGLNAIGPSANSVTYNANTGWIYGTLRNDYASVANTYNITANVFRTLAPLVTSNTFNYTITIAGTVDETITWITDSNLGEINNGEISIISVQAESQANLDLEYILDIGSVLPPGLTLHPTGEIQGRIPFESLSSLQTLDNQTVYSFTIVARSYYYPTILSSKTFNLTVVQRSITPWDNIYIVAMPAPDQSEIFSELITNASIIPTEYIYRSDDIYFGKSTSLIYNHMYGLDSSTTLDYVNSVIRNHYKRNITLGELQTAQATDNTGKVIYEVVYSLVIDNLINGQSISISKSIDWPRPIPAIGATQILYPNSLPNMREQVADNITVLANSNVLPRWMTSQQKNGSTVGYVQAAVICYTKPGYSEIIKNNINTLWNHTLNEINFQIDRFEIDRSLSHEFNSNIELWNPIWDSANSTLISSLPSTVSTNNSYDSYVFFSENILTDAVNTTPTLGLPLVLIYDTTIGTVGNTISLPLKGTVDVAVNWGDNTSSSFSAPGNYNHTYAAPGVYTVTISGILSGYGSSVINNTKLVCVTDWGNTGLTDLSNAFYGATNLTIVPVNIPDSIINTSYMFYGASKFNWNITNWNTSGITNMNSMFKNASFFNRDISRWSVGSVLSMNNMFQNSTIFNQDLSNWCVINIPSLPVDFNTGSALTTNNLPLWGTCP